MMVARDGEGEKGDFYIMIYSPSLARCKRSAHWFPNNVNAHTTEQYT